ncbi:MAG: peptidoglycan-associated lipoprotein Pal [Burkholderiaceae bacterium]
MKRILLATALTAFLAACGSNVKLDQPPVTDVTPTPTTQGAGGAGGTTGATTQSEVKPIIADPNANQGVGPNGARIVYFDYDSFTIKPEFQGVIDNQARFLKADAKRKIMVQGHTDERGGREYNLALGQKRSEAVRSALRLLGVQDSQVEAVSFGEEKPASAGADEGAWSKNRRAEIAYQ